MRRAIDKSQFTPFGIWLQEYCAHNLSITNLDYVIDSYTNKLIQLMEEKQSGGTVKKAQMLTFEVLDWCLYHAAPHFEYKYWGCYVLQFPHGTTMPGPGMTMNARLISCEQLQAHINFEQKFCEPYQFPWRSRLAVAAA